MSKKLSYLILLVFFLTSMTPGLYITYPEPEGLVSGIVEVRGSVPATNFKEAKLEYAYSNSATGTWFLIAKLDQVIQDDILAKWDTTTISDGTYMLRLKILYRDGKSDEIKVKNIRVANYTYTGQTPVGAIPTSPDSSVITDKTQEPEILPTPLPLNPASISDDQFKNSLYLGSAVAVAGFVLLGIYLGLRRSRRRR